METTHPISALKPVFNLLKYTFVVVPIVAGADKFLNLLTDWSQYVHPAFVGALPVAPAVFMKMVGIIEILAGLIVLKKATWGGYIVTAWLTVIAISLLAGGNFVDVAVRDIVMAIAAFSMAKISKIVQ